MKKVFLTMCAAAIALAFTSCNKEEKNSKLDFNSIKGTATIEGAVYFDAGFARKTVAGDKKVSDVSYEALDGKKVLVKISNSSGSVVDTKETTTKSDGTFSIELPASDNYALTAKLYIFHTWEYTIGEYNIDKSKYDLKTATATQAYTSAAITLSPDNTTALGNIILSADVSLDPNEGIVWDPSLEP